jgi:hypothetical protein
MVRTIFITGDNNAGHMIVGNWSLLIIGFGQHRVHAFKHALGNAG